MKILQTIMNAIEWYFDHIIDPLGEILLALAGLFLFLIVLLGPPFVLIVLVVKLIHLVHP